MRLAGLAVTAAFLAVLLLPLRAAAYVGPGAGFAFLSVFFLLFSAFLLALFTLLAWPLRRLLRVLRVRKRPGASRARRVIILGIDGLDPELTERLIGEGRLPAFASLGEKGAYARLETSVPAVSPVAWSSFMTGCNPGKHGIYDFLVPDFRSLLPRLSSSAVAPPRRTLEIGPYRLPVGRPSIASGRRGRSFWSILGEYGVPCTVLRVPITFPPEKYDGLLLSGMCVPDLKGSQGTYFYYTADPSEERSLSSGVMLRLRLAGEEAVGEIAGPENTIRKTGGEMKLSFAVRSDPSGRGYVLRIGNDSYPLAVGEYTPWISLVFRPGLGIKVRGICRFLLLEAAPQIRLYMTPLQIDPEFPALPVSHPGSYAVYLAKTQGPFATLGIAEDTSALNDGIVGEEAFLSQCDLIHEERERMFFDALDKTPTGLVTCVFDLADRVQHMFFHQLFEGGDNGGGEVVEGVYRRFDKLLQRVVDRLDDETVLLVVSDHGFKTFRREVDLNAWLKDGGYLALRDEGAGQDMLQAVDWSRTRAYAVGFGGIYLNLRGREYRGTVEPGEEAERLKREIADKLLLLRDGEGGESPVKRVFDNNEVYRGPYASAAPDLIVGFRVGFRAAWKSVTGGVGETVFSDNDRPWGSDHTMNPEDVPGILFCNRPIDRERLHIEDVAPSVLDLFGVPVPGHIDGRAAIDRPASSGPARSRRESSS